MNIKTSKNLIALALVSLFLNGCSETLVKAEEAKPTVQPSTDKAENQTESKPISVNKIVTGHEILAKLSSGDVDSLKSMTIDGKEYTDPNSTIDLGQYDKDKVVALSVVTKYENGSTYPGKIKLYNQDYSVIAAGVNSDNSLEDNSNAGAFIVKGEMTKTLPDAGEATYTGGAFSGESSSGKLSYTVDFSNKEGSGTISGLGKVEGQTVGDIALEKASIGNVSGGGLSGIGIQGKASAGSQTGTYKLGFAGPNAEEIVGGVAVNNSDVIGFGGKRGEITK